ncbi:helix-turn-helix domain-containing protein [Erythrobacter sp. HA6-11]
MSGPFLDTWEPSARHRRIRDAVAKALDIPPQKVIGRSRLNSLCKARHLAMWICRKAMPDLSMPLLGQLFAGRDHSMIYYGVTTHEKRMAADPALRMASQGLLASILQAERAQAGDDDRQWIDVLRRADAKAKSQRESLNEAKAKQEFEPAAADLLPKTVWCEQCDQRVCETRAARCASAFCKAKPLLLASEGAV